MEGLLDILPTDLLQVIFHDELVGLDGQYVMRMTCKMLNGMIPPQCLREVCIVAASADNVEILAYINSADLEVIMTAAVRGNSVRCVDNILGRGYPLKDIPIRVAAIFGRLEMLRHCHGLGLAPTTDDCVFAIMHDHIDIVKYIMEKCRTPTDEYRLIYAAANHDRLEILDYLLSIGTRFRVNAIYAAAARGHVRIVKYMHEGGYDNAADAWYIAVYNNQIPVVRYLVETRASLRIGDAIYIRAHGSPEIRRIMAAAGYPV